MPVATAMAPVPLAAMMYDAPIVPATPLPMQPLSRVLYSNTWSKSITRRPHGAVAFRGMLVNPFEVPSCIKAQKHNHPQLPKLRGGVSEKWGACHALGAPEPLWLCLSWSCPARGCQHAQGHRAPRAESVSECDLRPASGA